MAKSAPDIAKAPEDMVTVVIDPKMTDGGIRVNGKRYVGKVTVPSDMADDLLRIQSEYSAAKNKATDPSVKLRNQSIEVSKKSFMADPAVFMTNPRFSKDYGMLDPYQWQFIGEKDREEWRQERMGLYGY